MSNEKLTLQGALDMAQRFAVQGQIGTARDIFAQLQQQAKGQDLIRVTQKIVALERSLYELPRAHAALIHLMQKCCVSGGHAAQPGQKQALFLYGLGSAKHIRFHSQQLDDLSFSFNAGHFDTVSLLHSPPFGYDRCYLSPAADKSMLQKAFERSALIVNAMADPTMEQAALLQAIQLLEATPRPVVNHPARVLETARDSSAEQLKDIPGLVVPKVERCQPNAAYFAERFAASQAGLIIRPITSQTGIGMQKVETQAELVTATEHFLRQPEELFVTDYHRFDTQGMYRKMRAFRVGNELYPEHCITFNAWNVHSADRHKLMRTDNALRELEQRFVEHPAHVLGNDAWQTLHTATARLGLDYVGIDFAQLADGRLLLFECNPSMRVNFDHLTHFAYLRPGLERIAQAFTNMLATRI